MSIFSNLFGGKKTDKEVLTGLSQLETDSNFQKIAQLFDKAVEEEKSRIIDLLSQNNLYERQKCANFIRNQIVPALADEPRRDRRQQSLEVLDLLISELRPPNTHEEFQHFGNAVFWFTKRVYFSKGGLANPHV